MASKKLLSPLCEIRPSRIHGKGMFALEDLFPRQRLLEYVGRPISKAECDRLTVVRDRRAKTRQSGSVYVFEIAPGKWIDGLIPENIARFFNHSCKPNCESYSHKGRIWIRTLNPVRKGAELTIDYCLDVEEGKDHPCQCGVPGCVGLIVAKHHRSSSEFKSLRKKP